MMILRTLQSYLGMSLVTCREFGRSLLGARDA